MLYSTSESHAISRAATFRRRRAGPSGRAERTRQFAREEDNGIVV